MYGECALVRVRDRVRDRDRDRDGDRDGDRDRDRESPYASLALLFLLQELPYTRHNSSARRGV